MQARLVELQRFYEIGEVIVELPAIGDVAVSCAASAVAAQADRIDGGTRGLQRLGKLEHLRAGASGPVHQYDHAPQGALGTAGIETIVDGSTVARLDALHLGQLGEVPLRDAGDGVASGQHRRRGGRVEGDDAGEGTDDDQDEDAGGDEDATNHA